MRRYILAESWSHIFLEEDPTGALIERERSCRFVFDRDALDLVRVEVEVDGCMRGATSEEMADLLDSLVHANLEVIDDPGSYGFATRDRLPRRFR